ncbi:MAG: hypothetical protein E7632_06700 [Ruminococcaceae bacterium]|nr:hypothetical protein [Oscillospiraceae bacterium]
MANGVSVEKSAVRGGIGCAQTSIRELDGAAKSLARSYSQAGSGGWHDQKYAALGSIISECCGALNQPIAELEECIRKLEALLEAIEQYENTSL